MWGLWGAAWVSELDNAVFVAQTFSRDWDGYSKSEFLDKMPGTWYGATAIDLGAFVVVQNPEIFRYFELHFMFGEKDAPLDFLAVRGLNELQDLWIFGQSGKVVSNLEPANENSVSRDAKKAVKILEKKFGVRGVA